MIIFEITDPKFIGVLGEATFSAGAGGDVEWKILAGSQFIDPANSDLAADGVSTNPSIRLTALADPGAVTLEATVTVDGEMCVRTHTVRIARIDLIAYRPQTRVFDFEEFPIPEMYEDNDGNPIFPFVGAGIRLNGDDDNQNGVNDASELPGLDDDDLLAIDVMMEPGNIPGATLHLVRSSSIIRVIDNAGSYTLTPKSDESEIQPGQFPMRFWVTNTERGEVDLRLELRDDETGQVVASDTVTFRTFRTLVIALTGEELFGGNPFASGVTTIARELYAPSDGRFGYDVRLYDEDDVNSNGFGAAFNEAADAINKTGAMDIAIFGHSHGGGSTHDLAARLGADLLGGGWTLKFTAYIDAIRNSSDIDLTAETRIPIGSSQHLNLWQNITFIPLLGAVNGAPTLANPANPAPQPIVNIHVNSFPWGVGLTHGAIDDDPTVQNILVAWLRQNIQAP